MHGRFDFVQHLGREHPAAYHVALLRIQPLLISLCMVDLILCSTCHGSCCVKVCVYVMYGCCTVVSHPPNIRGMSRGEEEYPDVRRLKEHHRKSSETQLCRLCLARLVY